MKIIHNKILGGWYVVRGKSQTPISGRFDSCQEAINWLAKREEGRVRRRGREFFSGKQEDPVRHALFGWSIDEIISGNERGQK